MIQSPHSSIDENPGSDNPNEPGFLVVGRLMKPHGLKGELVMKVYTDFPERLTPGAMVFVGEDHISYSIFSVRGHKDSLLVGFDGVNNRNDAEPLARQWVRVPKDDRPPLPPGEYYHHEFIGLQVVTEEGHSLGEVGEILSTGANDVLVIKNETGHELLVPTTDEVLVAVDLKLQVITIKVIPGLLTE